MEGLDDIVEEFLVESHENLDQLDQDLVALEQDPRSRDRLSSIFRTIHTIKGTSGFLAFNRLEEVAHVGENLLSRLRDGALELTPVRTDALLQMVDTIRALLAAIEASGGEGSVVVADTVATLSAVLEDAPAPVAAPEPEGAPATAEVPAEVPVEALAAPAKPAPAKRAAAKKAPVKKAAPKTPRVTKAAAPAVPKPAPVPAAEMVPAAPAAPPAPAPAVDVPKEVPMEVPVAEAPALPPAAAEPVPEPGEERSGAQPGRRAVADSTIRVDVDLLDALMLLVGELVLTRNQIVQYVGRQTDQDLVRASQRLNLIASELQEGVMKTRMQPIDHIWSKLPRVVRDLGLQCGKSVRLEMEGRETELDKTLLEAVKDPLTHLVRNSVDHGVEPTGVRTAAGKPAEGVLTLRARHESGQVVVEVADDGAGIDPVKIGAKAVERGLLTPDALSRMSPADILQLVFLPGFSTAAAVTNVSGRGVGMDVVKTNIESIGGTIEVESVPGRGTCTRLRIPLTLAIVPALTIECAGDRYAIPQISLQELVALDAEKAAAAVEEVGGASVYRLRGELLPLVHLADVLGLPSDRHDGHVVIAVLRSEGRRFGLVVDRVINTEEIVVKAVGGQMKAIGLYSGATVLGDGAVALILDVQALARRALRAETAERQEARVAASVTIAVQERQRMLLAAIGGGRRVAIPLDTVTRLEQVRSETVERVGSREVVQYRGAILPIVRLDRHLGAFGDTERETLEVIVYADHGRSVAIVVEEILDIVDGEASVHSDIDDLGLLGSAVIGDRVTELLDVRAAILAADPAFYTTAPAAFPSPDAFDVDGAGFPAPLMEV
ncbi:MULTISPECIES: chemotaxis protein CheA [unclassified Modestobacter]|uniref:chemotaxis protein CheA n=1 Tax=unclassified Modestobacter TaxID=2643866 RepID=UPI0022AAA525|nr:MULTISPECIES: chemotaxis protein CheA [unclassified Modestobacter]MCZ2823084.1 chemotaxis protein CheA [Modestobacter sp. VKM Ac-2981]MCZ2851330.1 chemotaxis protein CheA [Modestobacter sp. VKM Ac-2982]